MARKPLDMSCDLHGWPMGSESQGYATWLRVGHRDGFCYGCADAGLGRLLDWNQRADTLFDGRADGGGFSWLRSGVPGRLEE